MNYEVSGRYAGESVESFRARRMAEVEKEVQRERERDARRQWGIMDNQFVDRAAIEARAREEGIEPPDWEAMGLPAAREGIVARHEWKEIGRRVVDGYIGMMKVCPACQIYAIFWRGRIVRWKTAGDDWQPVSRWVPRHEVKRCA